MIISMMKRVGFNSNWQKWVMECMSSVSYKILINESPSECIVPCRGIRQGDPMSFFLFVLCTEGLLASLVEKERVGLISGIKVRAKNPPITHLLFADDCYIFYKVKMSEIKAIMDCLQEFSGASGQIINHEKLALYFSSNTPRQFKSLVQVVLSMKHSQTLGNYIGLPSFISKEKASLFAFVEERSRSRVQW